MRPIYVSILPVETGRRIRFYMNMRGYSVRDVQSAMGFENPQAIYKWLSGKSLPSLDNLIILCYLLKVQMEDVLVVSGDIAA